MEYIKSKLLDLISYNPELLGNVSFNITSL